MRRTVRLWREVLWDESIAARVFSFLPPEAGLMVVEYLADAPFEFPPAFRPASLEGARVMLKLRADALEAEKAPPDMTRTERLHRAFRLSLRAAHAQPVGTAPDEVRAARRVCFNAARALDAAQAGWASAEAAAAHGQREALVCVRDLLARRQGGTVHIRAGPGCGKTSFALAALGTALELGIEADYCTYGKALAEETRGRARAQLSDAAAKQCVTANALCWRLSGARGDCSATDGELALALAALGNVTNFTANRALNDMKKLVLPADERDPHAARLLRSALENFEDLPLTHTSYCYKALAEALVAPPDAFRVYLLDEAQDSELAMQAVARVARASGALLVLMGDPNQRLFETTVDMFQLLSAQHTFDFVHSLRFGADVARLHNGIASEFHLDDPAFKPLRGLGPPVEVIPDDELPAGTESERRGVSSVVSLCYSNMNAAASLLRLASSSQTRVVASERVVSELGRLRSYAYAAQRRGRSFFRDQWLESMLGNATLDEVADVHARAGETSGRGASVVRAGTIHSSKGCEYENSLVRVGEFRGNLRLLLVGVTRAAGSWDGRSFLVVSRMCIRSYMI